VTVISQFARAVVLIPANIPMGTAGTAGLMFQVLIPGGGNLVK